MIDEFVPFSTHTFYLFIYFDHRKGFWDVENRTIDLRWADTSFEGL